MAGCCGGTGRGRDEVGHILVQIQDDLLQLKKQLAHVSIQGHGEKVDIQALETAIQRTELGLRKHAEEYLNFLNTQVLTIPLAPRESHSSRVFPMPAAEMGPKPCLFPQMPDSKAQAAETWIKAAHLSPGEQHRLALSSKIILDPENAINRTLLNENLGIMLPHISRRKAVPVQSEKIVKGPTVQRLSVLPATHRIDASLTPPPVTEKDAKKGLLSLTERGLIPAAAQLTLVPSPISSQLVSLHDFQQIQKAGVFESTSGGIKRQPEPKLTEAMLSTATEPAQDSTAPLPYIFSGASSKIMEQATPPPDTQLLLSPASEEQPSSLEYTFVIYNGVINHNNPDFMAFKQFYCLSWGNILSLLQHLEAFLLAYAVPAALVNGSKMMEVLLDFEVHQKASKDMLLSILGNQAAVKKILSRPGQRYRGVGGREAAAAKIQATWKRYTLRKAYLKQRQHQWAVGVIAISWILHLHKARVKGILKESRQRHLESFRMRAKHLADNWNRIRTSRRTIIHIPSLGYPHGLRASIRDLGLQQNLQMGRLCEIRDANVDVIYICPLELHQETLQYYSKLLGLQAAVRSGNPQDMTDLQDRFKILTPEAINSFPGHSMCLATLLKYSPRTLQRIKLLTHGKDAYIVGGLIHQDDLAVADILNIPVLGSEPGVAQLYSTKSGSKRIFVSAGVPTPPGDYNIYSLQQMMDTLSQLITDNLEVKRWLFKMDTGFRGTGTAYCDIATHMQCYRAALKDFQKYGPEKWKKKWAQEETMLRISQELPNVLTQYAQPLNKKRFPTWEKFLQAFLNQGGVIEAFPPSDSITNLTVDMLIEPTGEISLVSSGDQLHASSPLEYVGTSVPQASIDSAVLNAICWKVGEACRAKGLLGYFSLDLVTFIHPHTMEQQVWATDLDPFYSDQLALTQLLLYVTQGELNCSFSRFEVPAPPVVRPVKQRRRRREPEEVPPMINSRYAVMSSHLQHTNLSIIYYSVFFQICKAHGIGYDVKEKQGTVFVLHENHKRQNLGMLTIGEDLQGALMTFAHNLFIIHQEISAPNMQGETNFKDMVQDIETILGVTEENKLIFEKQESSREEMLPMIEYSLLES
ncbi:IQ domain-containing protein H [Microcaecilia unicolor]|uniref:IQ domain-containing protein H n=1 Tax=Microcaecilia unicolor TaxID=1415580 RepID=A0A6P7XDK4_9AMPH|nr:IQ domain-containing protein H [Microcaecilia unicolor]